MQMRRYRTRPGTAMGEMVLVLPLLLVIVALLVFFGRGVVRVQHAQVMDRYEAWRQAAASPGPAAQAPDDNPQLNQLFFGDNAASIEYAGNDYFPGLAVDRLIDAAITRNVPDHYQLPELVEAATAGNAPGRTVTFTTTHSNSVPLWERFNRPTRHRHTRIGNDWAHVNGWTAPPGSAQDNPVSGQWLGGSADWRRAGPYGPNVLPPIRDVFFPEFDADLANVGNPLAEAIRSMYLSQNGYSGPNVEE